MTASTTSVYVEEFSSKMEYKLSLNRHKGDREGWMKENIQTLVDRAYEELDEVQRALNGCATCEEVTHECADVANFCMMIADKYTNG